MLLAALLFGAPKTLLELFVEGLKELYYFFDERLTG
jgi:hypothetical protein